MTDDEQREYVTRMLDESRDRQRKAMRDGRILSVAFSVFVVVTLSSIVAGVVYTAVRENEAKSRIQECIDACGRARK